MVAIDDIKNSIIFKELGVIPEYTDIDLTIPAGTTITVTYTTPAGYAWVKVDVRGGPIANRVMKWSVTYDESVEFTDIEVSMAQQMESFRCVLAGIAYTGWTAKMTNMDTVAHTADALVRAFLIRKEDVPKLLTELRKISLSDEDIDKLATKIAEKISAKERRRRG